MITINLMVQCDEESLYHRVLVVVHDREERSVVFDREFVRQELTPVYLQKALTSVLSEAAHLGVFDPADLPA